MMKVSSPRNWIPIAAMALLSMFSVRWPAFGRADVVQSPGTESSAGGATDAWLVTRGLIGHGMVSDQAGVELRKPALGVEVEETRQTVDRTGEVLMRVKLWNE